MKICLYSNFFYCFLEYYPETNVLTPEPKLPICRLCFLEEITWSVSLMIVKTSGPMLKIWSMSNLTFSSKTLVISMILMEFWPAKPTKKMIRNWVRNEDLNGDKVLICPVLMTMKTKWKTRRSKTRMTKSRMMFPWSQMICHYQVTFSFFFNFFFRFFYIFFFQFFSDDDSNDAKSSSKKPEKSDDPEPKEASTPPVQESEEDDLVEVEDNDDYLLYLEPILKNIHKCFYDFYDQIKEKDEKSEEIPDLKTVIPYVKKKVLQGCSVVFSGVVPTHITLEKSKAYKIARSLGAKVTKEFSKETTHLVAAR